MAARGQWLSAVVFAAAVVLLAAAQAEASQVDSCNVLDACKASCGKKTEVCMQVFCAGPCKSSKGRCRKCGSKCAVKAAKACGSCKKKQKKKCGKRRRRSRRGAALAPSAPAPAGAVSAKKCRKDHNECAKKCESLRKSVNAVAKGEKDAAAHEKFMNKMEEMKAKIEQAKVAEQEKAARLSLEHKLMKDQWAQMQAKLSLLEESAKPAKTFEACILKCSKASVTCSRNVARMLASQSAALQTLKEQVVAKQEEAFALGASNAATATAAAGKEAGYVTPDIVAPLYPNPVGPVPACEGTGKGITPSGGVDLVGPPPPGAAVSPCVRVSMAMLEVESSAKEAPAAKAAAKPAAPSKEEVAAAKRAKAFAERLAAQEAAVRTLADSELKAAEAQEKDLASRIAADQASLDQQNTWWKSATRSLEHIKKLVDQGNKTRAEIEDDIKSLTLGETVIRKKLQRDVLQRDLKVAEFVADKVGQQWQNAYKIHKLLRQKAAKVAADILSTKQALKNAMSNFNSIKTNGIKKASESKL